MIHRSRLARVLLIGVLLGACDRVEVGAPAGGSAASPNVLLVTIDTLRADHVGAYGASGAHTPTLDRLARQGVLFEHAFTVAPLTLPAHASILTGRWPQHHGVRHNAMFVLDETVPTLPDVLQRSGYHTGAVVGAVVLRRGTGLERGFASYDDQMGGRRSARAGYTERRADAVTDRALDWLETVREPFFLWAHYFDPHAVYAPPPPFAERFAHRPYDGEIAFVDAELGRLLEGLRARGSRERTLVAVTADHGESLGEHGEATHGYTLYDATLAVPLILQGPGVPAGARIPGVVSVVDLAPTLLARVGAVLPEGIDGMDLAPTWRGSDPSARASAYAETLATQLDHGWAPLHALRTPRALYVRAPRPELYDVARDPREVHNLLEGDGPPSGLDARPFEAELDTLLAHARALEPGAVSDRTRAQLRALGYAIAESPVPYTGTDPKDGLPWAMGFERAVEDYLAGRTDRPRRYLHAMLEALPSSPLAHGLLAAVELADGRPREALPHAEAAARLVPRSPDHASLLGDVRRALGDPEGALEAYRRATRLDPARPEPWRAIAEVERELGRPEAAAEARRQALSRDPGGS